jgi:phosphoglycolate phosphatase
MICCEAYDFIPKHEILKQVKGNYKNNQVMVGDRFHDIDAAVKNGIQSVYCEYGYGKRKEGEGATVHIKDISEILEIL